MLLNGRMATNGGFRPWVSWVGVLIVLLAVAGFAMWVVKYGLKPVPDASPTASLSSAPVAPSGIEAADGAWCPPDDSAELGCVTVDLPTVAEIDSEASSAPIYVVPPDSDADADPLTFDFGFAPNLGDCWQATIGTSADEADAAFIYCPVGATSGDADLDKSDSTTERLWITQDLTSAPMVRAAGS